MFKKEIDPEKEKLKRKMAKRAKKVKIEAELRRKKAELLRNKAYVEAKLREEKERQAKFEKIQREKIKKSLKDVDRAITELEQFNCVFCGAPVNMSNLTCPNCGQLYCQWCGAPMDMENPALCPRCGRPPYYTPAQDVITKVEDLAPEDRFWEQLPECPKCGATVQPDWDECPICGAKLTPGGGSAAAASSSGSAGANMAPGDMVSGDKKRRKKKEKKRGI